MILALEHQARIMNDALRKIPEGAAAEMAQQGFVSMWNWNVADACMRHDPSEVSACVLRLQKEGHLRFYTRVERFQETA